MQSKTFSSCINLLQVNYGKDNYGNCKMVSNNDVLNVWYQLLKHFTDEQFIKATEKIMLNEIFPPKLDTFAKYCSEIAAPVIDDTEGWGLVVKAINTYGYMRVEQAMQSLPQTVRKAVEYMGGLKLICESEEPDVIRGQFNKCMAAINQRERANRREKNGLMDAIALMNSTDEPLKIELEEWKRSGDDVTNEGIAKVHEAYKKAREDRDK